MVSDTDDARRSRRFFVAALALSALIHLLGFAFYLVGTGALARIHPFARTRPTPQPPVFVSISNATIVRKRAVPRPVPRSNPRNVQPHKPLPPQKPQRARLPVTPQRPLVPRPKAQPPARTLHELAKQVPRAPQNPPKTVRATPPPRVAVAEKPAPVAPAVQAAHAQTAALQRVDRDLEKALVAMRRDNDPLAVRTEPPSAPKRYKVQMRGALAQLHDAQGLCHSLKEWQEGAYDYYYETCDVVFDDGHTEVQAVPWPIRYPRGRDPLQSEQGVSGMVPLPGPLAGWRLPPGEYISKELRAYAHERGVDI